MSGNSVVAMPSLKTGQQLISFAAGPAAGITHDCAVVVASESSHSTGSSHIKTNTIVDYAWEHKYYDGHIVASRGEYLAYAIKGKSGGVVRVVSRGTDDRALIKGMTGAVKDLAFAHTSNETLLAVVDEAGNLSVFTVDEDLNKKLVVAPYLGLRRDHDSTQTSATCHRVVWCPYIPDEECEEESEETAKLLLLAHGRRADLLNVAILAEEHGPGPHLIGDLTEGYMEILDHGHAITDAAFSPDGTALATASADGYVKFFQIYMQDKDSPRMLHEWQPHDGDPLSALFFLDNHRDLDPNEPFWKYAVTGARLNTELKVWTCESWNCLQTIRLEASPAGELPASTHCLQACLDSSAQYLLLSDIHKRMLYVFSLSGPETAVKYFTSVHEFRLMNPALSLAIVDARRRRIKPFENLEHLEADPAASDPASQLSIADDAEDDTLVEGVVIRCYMVQPRSLQECVVVYQSPGEPDPVTSLNGQSLDCMTDHLSDLTLNTTVASAVDADAPADSPLISPFADQPPLSLMTPDALTSPSKTGTDTLDEPTAPLADSSSPTGFLREAPSAVPAPVLPPIEKVLPPIEKKSGNSCGSSPSIEVQEILNKSASKEEILPMESTSMSKPLFPSPPPPPDLMKSAGPVGVPVAGPVTPAAAAAAAAAAAVGGAGQNGWPTVPTVEETATTAAAAVSAPSGGGDEKRDVCSACSAGSAAVVQAVTAAMTTVRELSCEVEQLRAQVQLLQHRQHKQSTTSPTDVNRLLETALTTHQRHIEELLLTRDREERQRSERQVTALSQSVTSSFKQKADTAIRQEFKEHVVPLVTNRLKSLEGQIRHEMSARIGDVEALFKESVCKTVSVKGVSEAVAQALVQSLQQTIATRYREMFASTALPAFERSTRELLQQINSSFSAGTREYVQQMEQQVEGLRRQRDPALQQLQQTLDTVRLSVEQTATAVSDGHQRQEKLKEQEAALLALVRDEIRRSLATGLEEHSARAAERAAAADSAAKPISQQILQMVELKEYNTAFQLALSASDLDLVVMTCGLVEPQQLFAESPPCPLAQPVLLALVQQLSTDLSAETQLKCRYLEEAVMQIDSSHPATRDHLRPVLATLQTKLQAFVSQPPGAQAQPLVRSMRMLLMAVRSLAA